MLALFSFFAPSKILVKSLFFDNMLPIVKNTIGEKVGILSKYVQNDYVNHATGTIRVPPGKQPVEKPVETVEKLENSTRLLPFSLSSEVVKGGYFLQFQSFPKLENGVTVTMLFINFQ